MILKYQSWNKKEKEGAKKPTQPKK